MGTLSISTAIILVASTPSVPGDSFRLSGVVSDGAGKPVPFVRVTAVSAAGRELVRPGVCGTEGEYSMRFGDVVEALIFVDQRGARCLRLAGPWKTKSRVNADFSRAKLFTLRGRIVDSAKTLMRGLMDPGARWNGKFDSVARRMVSITAYAGNLKLLTVNPDERGSFRIASDFPITHIVLESAGGFSVRKDGPWARNANVDIKPSRESTFTLRGKVEDSSRVPQRHTRVVARDASGKKLVEGYTLTSGKYSLRCDREVAMVEAQVSGAKCEQRGPWKANATVDLRPAPKRGFPIRGRVVDETGKGIRGVRIVAVGEDGRSVDHSLSDAQGTYGLIASRPVAEVLAYRASHRQAEKEKGPWTSDASVDFKFSKTGKLTITGCVRTKSGVAASDVPVTAYDFSGKPIVVARTGRDGRYRLTASQPVSRVQAIARGRRSTVSGPWEADHEVDITLRH